MASETLEATLTRLTAGRNSWKDPCRACATSAITLSGEQTIDGVAIVSGDRVLVTAQASGAANGIYVCSSGAWRRAADLSVNVYARPGMTVRVISGTANSGLWGLTSPTTGSISLGSTSMTFEAIATGGASAPVPQAFAELLTLSGNTTDVYAGENGGVCVTGLLAGATHVVGSTHVRRIPSGTATSIATATDLDPEGTWDAFDAARDYYLTLYCASASPLEVICSGRVAQQTAAAPTIVSATVPEANPNALVVVWDAPVFVSALTGLSLTFSSGTSRTLTAVESGNGTTSVTFTLSGNFDGSEVASFVVGAGRVAQSLNGTLVTAETEAIDNAWTYVMPGELHLWRGDSITESGSNVLTVVDQVGSATMTSSATKPTKTTLGGQTAWTFIANAYMTSPGSLADDMTDFAILLIVDFASLSTTGNGQKLVSATLVSAVEGPSVFDYNAAGTDALYCRTVDAATGDLSPAFSTTTPTCILFTGSGTAREVYVGSGTAAASNSAAADAGNVAKWTLGVHHGTSILPFLNGVMAECRIGNQHLDATQAAAALAYAAARYGTPGP